MELPKTVYVRINSEDVERGGAPWFEASSHPEPDSDEWQTFGVYHLKETIKAKQTVTIETKDS